MFREHLEYLQDRGHQLPGDPALIAAAMGGMLSMLAYALLSAGPAKGPSGGGAPDSAPGYSSSDVIDSLTRLLLYGLVGPADS